MQIMYMQAIEIHKNKFQKLKKLPLNNLQNFQKITIETLTL